MIDGPFRIRIGSKMIADMLNPKPEELDLDAIDANLKSTIRFAGAPGAINVHQHRHLVGRLVRLDRLESFGGIEATEELYQDVRRWAHHHDDHEGIIGDIVAPVKTMISAKTNVLEIAEVQLDKAICDAHGFDYPSETIRGLVYRYDKAAETIEWIYAMGREQTDWNHPCPDHLLKQGRHLIEWARALT